MSRKQNFNSTQQQQSIPSAPFSNTDNSDIFQPRAPPPSYEESQKQTTISSNNFQQFPTKNGPISAPPPTYNASIGNMYAIPQSRAMQIQRNAVRLYGVSPLLSTPLTSVQMQNKSVTPKVVEFDSGARFNGKGAGSLVIPPPPPGYAPTAAQLAAMQGQPVVLQKKKKSFF